MDGIITNADAIEEGATSPLLPWATSRFPSSLAGDSQQGHWHKDVLLDHHAALNSRLPNGLHLPVPALANYMRADSQPRLVMPVPQSPCDAQPPMSAGGEPPPLSVGVLCSTSGQLNEIPAAGNGYSEKLCLLEESSLPEVECTDDGAESDSGDQQSSCYADHGQNNKIRWSRQQQVRIMKLEEEVSDLPSDETILFALRKRTGTGRLLSMHFLSINSSCDTIVMTVPGW
jgi:hypothetical protein